MGEEPIESIAKVRLHVVGGVSRRRLSVESRSGERSYNPMQGSSILMRYTLEGAPHDKQIRMFGYNNSRNRSTPSRACFRI